jgi:hypothetical protein
MMDEYYKNLKAEVGIEDTYAMEDDDSELDGILSTLKPNTTPENFKEFILGTSSVNRN